MARRKLIAAGVVPLDDQRYLAGVQPGDQPPHARHGGGAQPVALARWVSTGFGRLTVEEGQMNP